MQTWLIFMHAGQNNLKENQMKNLGLEKLGNMNILLLLSSTRYVCYMEHLLLL